MDELESSETSFAAEESRDAAGVVTITLKGELDISSAESFRQLMEQMVEDDPERLVFDLHELAFMDSSGIAVMVYVSNHVKDVELRHASDIIRRVVEATGLADVLRLDPS
jgi:anti-sigma B factor antagonist